MIYDKPHISQRRLRTPRAAAIAGILFAILQITASVIFLVSLPADSIYQTDWLEEQSRNISFALGLMPFAGIAFLWFMGVIRDRLGHLEDQFFSTLFFGSGLLYLAMTFATAAIAGGLITVHAFDPVLFNNSDFYLFGRAMLYKFNSVFGIRMAGMFTIALGTIWFRTQLMPRWMALFTFLSAGTLLIGITFYPWITLLFPIWVLITSAYILFLNYRFQQAYDGVTLSK
jgi:hypothetical protein